MTIVINMTIVNIGNPSAFSCFMRCETAYSPFMPKSRDQPLVEAFAHVLRSTREARGISQLALARSAGIDGAYVSMLEAAKRQPTLSVLCGLAEALGLAPEKLLQRARKRAEQIAGDQTGVESEGN